MQLVIAEKPSVGVSLADVLGAKQRRDGYIEGNGYIVSWCVGHLVGLADAAEYNEHYGKWRREDLPIIPDIWKYAIFDSKKKQLNILRDLLTRPDVKSIVCATDAGREGELIFRFVYQVTNCRKPFFRLWISSMEESAIRKGFAEMKDGSEYDNLYHSAICRSKADWLIGINATRLFSTMYNKTLNVGRVQTPTLAMLADRSEKISGFVKEKYHIVRLVFDTDSGEITALSEHIKDPEKANQIQAACQKRQAVCISVKSEQKTISPPKLFDLTALQRECNRLFGYTAMQTLDVAQKLYESKLITYPRTDSRYLTSDMETSLPGLVQTAAALIGVDASVTTNTGQLINDAKVSDHHAIIPTPGISNADITKLPENERNILTLITSRLVCALGDKHVYESITATFDCNGHIFTAKGKTVIAAGWKATQAHFQNSLKLNDPDTDEENRDADNTAMTPISEGQVFDDTDAKITDHFTKPPKQYTEDTLLSAMENAGAEDTTNEVERRGLGTPATRAAIIEKLVTSGFATRKGRQITPTEDGENLIKILPDSLKSPALTADWENSLTQIAKGKLSPDDFMHDIENMTRALVSDNPQPIEQHINTFKTPREVIGICPRCGSSVFESKKNFHCEKRECQFVMWKSDRFFTTRKKELTKPIATELLKTGKVKIKGMYSEKTGKTYDAVILLADTGGKYVNYRFDINGSKQPIA